MLIAGIALGLILGLLVGGRLTNLAEVRLRLVPLIAAAVVLRFATEALLAADVPIVETLRLPLLATAFSMLLVGLWANRAYPGMTLAFVGTLANALVIVVNQGYMPVWRPALTLAGLTPADIESSIHLVFEANLDANFLLHLGPLGDVIPIPFPFIENVASVGDVFLAAGLAFFLFASIVGIFPEVEEARTGGGRRSPAGQLRSLAGARGSGGPRTTALPGRPRDATLVPDRRLPPRSATRGRRAPPSPSVRQARAQRIVLGVVGRSVHLDVR